MSENAPKVCLSDIMSVLSDPSVIPSLVAERAAVSNRLAQIDRMLAILRPVSEAAPEPRGGVVGAARIAAASDEAFVLAVFGSMRPGHEYRTADIAKAVRGMPRDVYGALSMLRLQSKVDSNGLPGPGCRWFLL